MLPLKKADKNAKAPEKDVKPPAWKTKPKPPPHKNVEHPTNYAGKVTDIPNHDLEGLLPPVKLNKKVTSKGGGGSLGDNAAKEALDTIDQKRKKTLSKFLLM